LPSWLVGTIGVLLIGLRMRIAGFLAANDKQSPFGARKTAASPLLLGRV